MDHKVYIYNNKATFVCPDCNRHKTVDVSRFISAGKVINVTCRCICGHTRRAFLERRRFQRKPITLPGIYSRPIAEGHLDKGPVVVLDLSCAGVKIRPHHPSHFDVGERLRITFNLNDEKQSLVKKDAVVVNVHPDHQMGMAFCETDTRGPIGPYLFG